MSDPIVEGSANEIFPCLDPAHPEMRDQVQRLLTFQGANWPQYGLRATPRDLAAAGLFYFGKLRCCMTSLLFTFPIARDGDAVLNCCIFCFCHQASFNFSI